MQQDRDRTDRTKASPLALVRAAAVEACSEVQASFERFCPLAGIAAIETLLQEAERGWGPIQDRALRPAARPGPPAVQKRPPVA